MKPETVRNNILQVMFCLESATHHRLSASALVRATAAHAAEAKLDHDAVVGVESGNLVRMLTMTREAIRYMEGSRLVVAEGSGWKLSGAGRLWAHKLPADPALTDVAGRLEKLLILPLARQTEHVTQPQVQAS